VLKGVFNDKNPAADPSSGGMVDMRCAIFNADRRDALSGMKKWCKDRRLPDGTTGRRSSGKLRLRSRSQGVSQQCLTAKANADALKGSGLSVPLSLKREVRKHFLQMLA
jgi:hypothetical protein